MPDPFVRFCFVYAHIKYREMKTSQFRSTQTPTHAIESLEHFNVAPRTEYTREHRIIYTFTRLTNERVVVAFQPGFGYIVAINLKRCVRCVCFLWLMHGWLTWLRYNIERMHCHDVEQNTTL